jgi:hypothetical protein
MNTEVKKSKQISNVISLKSLLNDKLKLCLTMICLDNTKKDFYKFYNEIQFMLKS